MRWVDFKPDQPGFLTDEQQVFWDNWSARAEAATEKALKHWKDNDTSPTLSGDLWSELKGWLLDEFFFDKCAYCEGPIGATSFGDAEHYRPKGQVTVKKDGNEVKVTLEDGKVHPGYFWLAYDWQNLVPACQRCNSTGKGTLFPLPDGVAHEFKPGTSVDELDNKEKPELLHPCRDKPEEHLEFLKHGLVRPKDGSSKGKASIETYMLDREKLNTQRAERQAEAGPAFQMALVSSSEGIDFEKSMNRYTGERAPYSVAAKAFILEKWDEVSSMVNALVDPN